MNFPNSNLSHRNAAWRRLPVEWLEHPGALRVVFLSRQSPAIGRGRLPGRAIAFGNGGCRTLTRLPIYGSTESRPTVRNEFAPAPPRLCGEIKSHRWSQRAFTILELMLVVGIIGLMAAMALPHLSGFTKANAMAAATRQLLDDVGLARQRALANRSMVCMVFLPPNFWTNYPPSLMNNQFTNLVAHQYCGYALISMRTVGDQPGVSHVHYLTDWKYLPQGVYISPFQLTNSQIVTNWISTMNTTVGLSNVWPVSTFFATNVPFPSTYNATNNVLPYIGFTPSGQLTAGYDQYIMLTSGSIFYPMDNNGVPQFAPANLVETPPSNAFSNPNLIHIDWLTARARVERNQF